ncbi:low temperature-induced protein [Sphingomonas sabuli]|uniref:Low temperature-induced protein n=1 Tax=Sphingomonas sabuli TaxID=2764186 RepID=A0A7G9L4N9_9SPHN|nr:general stress protein [Sphingomonas sabuli]QNM83588.1 low temperature-induced protein [Sphingomonas sabuli]
MSDRTVSAVFDSSDEAQAAVSELRSAGFDEQSISIIGQHGEQVDADSDGDGLDEGGAVKGAIGGAVGGTLLGIAALAIPGVGPFVAAGAIASAAIPGAAAIGAGAGAITGGLVGLLSDHGVEDDDAAYYEERINDGGIFVSVDSEKGNGSPDEAREILFRNGGHNATRARTASV